MPAFIHQRHKPPNHLPDECELIVACPPMRSNINLARIVRVASCSGVERLIVCGRPKIDRKIARNALDQVRLDAHRSLAPVLPKWKNEGFQLVGLEQTTHSECLYDFRFPQRTVLVLGHERMGITEDVLGLLDHVIEVPVFGLPHSFNVVTATAMALYEYCRQHGECVPGEDCS